MAPSALRSVLTVLLLLALAPAPQASAQGEAAPIRIMEDLGGDLQTDAGTPGPVPRGSMDLRFLDIAESLENLTLTVGVSPDTGHADQGMVEIHFAHGDAEFRLHMEQRNMVGGWWWMFNLYRLEPEGESFVAIGEALPRDTEAGTVTVMLAKKDLADRAGLIPYVGRQLTGFWAESLPYSTPVPLRDRMPDAGNGADFTFALGEVQTGDLELWSSSPTRASNGEATTVVFTVTARHSGDADARFVFAAEGVPDAWEVVFPQPAPLLGPGETADFPVLIGLPFRHQHGKVEDVRVTLTGLDDDADRGNVRLSVNYHTVPQPAGHHPDVFLHSSTLGDIRTPAFEQSGIAVWNRVWMNTLDEFDADDELSVPGTTTATTGVWSWASTLDPVLQMGLDFDLARSGAMAIPFSSRLGIPDAVLGGTLDIDWQDANGDFQTLALADVVGAAPQAIGETPTLLSAAIVARPEADLVPYREGANLVLRLTLQGTSAAPRPDAVTQDVIGGETGPEKPWLDPGGRFSLPLFEYSDPVDGLFSSLGGVEVRVDGAAQRMGNPGEVVRFPVLLRFKEDAEFQVTFAGQGAANAQVVGGPKVTAGTGGTTFEVAVTIPADAQDGDLLDILVLAQKADDPGVQGIVRVVPEADTQADHADMPVAGANAADAPATPLWMALAALAALATARRRRAD